MKKGLGLPSSFTFVLFILSLLNTNPKVFADEEVTKANWTILIFLNGDNDLDSAGDEDVNEMEVVGSSSLVKIVVQQDKFGNSGTKRYLIEKDSDVNKISSPVIEDVPEVDMGDWNELVKFVKWGMEKYPARHYLVTIWNHGAGWEKRKRESIKGVSYDDTSNHHLTAADLTLAFSEIKKANGGKNIDLVGFDACLMSTAEIMEQLFGYADYVVSSEEVEPWDGWPYNDLLEPLVNNPKLSPREFGKIIVEKYGISYSGGSQGKQSVTQSLVDLIHWPAFREILNSFTIALLRNEEYNLNNIKKAVSKAQSYYFSHYRDITHFAMLLKEEAKETSVIVAWSDILIAAVKNVVLANFTSPEELPNSNGIALYIPPSKYSFDAYKDAYNKLYWSTLTSWGKFVETIYYPKFPILSLKNISILDNNDRVEPGEIVKIDAKVKNDGSEGTDSAMVMVENASDYIKILNGSADFGVTANGETTVNTLEIQIDQNTPIGSLISLQLLLFKDKIVVDKKELKFKVVKPLFAIAASISSPHDYPLNFNQSWEFMDQKAGTIAIHFSRFDTEKKYDNVTITDKDGNSLAKYSGNLGIFWTDEFPVNYIKITFTSDGVVNRYGFDIDYFGVTLLNNDSPEPVPAPEPLPPIPTPPEPVPSDPEPAPDEPAPAPIPPENEDFEP